MTTTSRTTRMVRTTGALPNPVYIPTSAKDLAAYLADLKACHRHIRRGLITRARADDAFRDWTPDQWRHLWEVTCEAERAQVARVEAAYQRSQRARAAAALRREQREAVALASAYLASVRHV